MAAETPRFVQCPKCHQRVPLNAGRCQFCGQSLLSSPPAAMAGVRILHGSQRKKYDLTWQEWGYIVCSSLIVLNGVFDLLVGFAIVPTAAVTKYGGGTYYGITGAVEVTMGSALLSQQLWAQFIMKWVCVLAILAELRSLLFSSALASLYPVPALAYVLSLVKIIVLGFTIYFIVDMADV